jgi:hypothetical protein
MEKRKAVSYWLAENASGLRGFIANLNRAASYHDPQNRGAQSPTISAASNAKESAAIERLLEGGMLEKKGQQTCVPANYAAYLKGGWLEEYFWLVSREIEKDKRLTRARFAINVKIDPVGNTTQTKHPLNELDGVVVHRNRMLIAECKTGIQLGDEAKGQDILNKLEVLGEHAAGKFAKKLLLTTQPNVDQKTAERAKRYQIQVITADGLPNLKNNILEWMGH